MFKAVVTSLFSISSKWLNVGLFKLLGYYKDGVFGFSENNQQDIQLTEIANLGHRPKVLIVARRHYTELNRTYPLESRSEVKKLVRLEYAEQRVHYKIAGVENGKTRVNIWIFNPQVPQAYLTLPESLLLATTVNDNQLLQVNSQPAQFLLRHNNLLLSQLSGALITDPQSFAMSVGAPANLLLSELAPSAFAGVVLRAVKTLGLAELALFFAMPPITPSTQSLKGAVLPGVLIFALYMLASSGYLLGYKAYLQSQIDQQTQGIDTALDASANMEAQLARYQHIQGFMAQQIDIGPVWWVMAEVFPQAKLSRFDLSQGRFVLAGQTDRATSLLEKLNNHPLVAEARFDNPTRNSRGNEHFVVSFTVKPMVSEPTDTPSNAVEVTANDAGN